MDPEINLLPIQTIEDIGELISSNTNTDSSHTELIIGVFNTVYRKRRMEPLIQRADEIAKELGFDAESALSAQGLARVASNSGESFDFDVSPEELGARVVTAMQAIEAGIDLVDMSAVLFRPKDEDMQTTARTDSSTRHIESTPSLTTLESSKVLFIGRKVTIGSTDGKTRTIEFVPIVPENEGEYEGTIIDIDGEASVIGSGSMSATAKLNLLYFSLGNFGKPISGEDIFNFGILPSARSSTTNHSRLSVLRTFMKEWFGSMNSTETQEGSTKIISTTFGTPEFSILSIETAREPSESELELARLLKSGTSRFAKPPRMTGSKKDSIMLPLEKLEAESPQAKAVLKTIQSLAVGRYLVRDLFYEITGGTTTKDLGDFANFICAVARRNNMNASIQREQRAGSSTNPLDPIGLQTRRVNNYFLTIK